MMKGNLWAALAFLGMLSGCVSTTVAPLPPPLIAASNPFSPDFDRLNVNSSQLLGQMRVDYHVGRENRQETLIARGDFDHIAFIAQMVVPSGFMDKSNTLKLNDWWIPRLLHEGTVKYEWDEGNWNVLFMTPFSGGVPDFERTFVHLPWAAGEWRLGAPPNPQTQEWSFVVTAYGVNGTIGPPPYLTKLVGSGCMGTHIMFKGRAPTLPARAIPSEYTINESPEGFPFHSMNYRCETLTGPGANATDALISLSGLGVIPPNHLQQNVSEMHGIRRQRSGPYVESTVTNSDTVAAWLRGAGIEPHQGDLVADVDGTPGSIRVLAGNELLYGVDFVRTNTIADEFFWLGHMGALPSGWPSLASQRIDEGLGATVRIEFAPCETTVGVGKLEAAPETLPGRWGENGSVAYAFMQDCRSVPLDISIWQGTYIVPPAW